MTDLDRIPGRVIAIPSNRAKGNSRVFSANPNYSPQRHKGREFSPKWLLFSAWIGMLENDQQTDCQIVKERVFGESSFPQRL